MTAITRDPHHGGTTSWKFDSETKRLYHRSTAQTRWTEAKRVSFTPARILALAKIIEQAFAASAEHKT